MPRTVDIYKQGTLAEVAEDLARYYTRNSPRLTGALRRSWQFRVGQLVAVVYSTLPYSYRIRRAYNRAMRDVLNNGIADSRRRHPGYTYAVRQSGGAISITIRRRNS